jgi:hypothetical protein
MSEINTDLPPVASKPLKKILVVGDWVVDEHWVIGIHRSVSSSRIGHAHYRALHFSNSTVESLCAAGRTASILDQAKCNGEPYCQIIGIGLWHDEDTDTLTAMLDPKCGKAKTPHQVTRKANEESTGRLFNLSQVLKSRAGENSNYSCGTTRMIRIYQHTGSNFELIQRIDWELRLPSSEASGEHESPGRSRESEEHTVVATKEEELDRCGLKEWFEQNFQSIEAIVIKDVRKGVISEAMIGWLVKKFEEANKDVPEGERKQVPWFISTKAWWPGWFDKLPKDKVRLMLIPQMAAQSVVRTSDLNCWVTHSGDASSKALKMMEKLGQLFNKALIVTLPDGLSVLARDCTTDENKSFGMVQTDVGGPELAVGVPMASVFFPALITGLMRRNEGKDVTFERLLKDALCFTHNWMSIEVKRVEEPETWQPREEQTLVIESQNGKADSGDVKPFDGNWKPFNWKRAMDYWKEAFSNYGYIEERTDDAGAKGKKVLELWRAMTEVDGYVCCMKKKRSILQRVVNDLGAFDVNSKDSRSCMFIASPGSGKTFLVRRLAVTLKLRYLGFNITQMISKSDLLDCFDTIVTNQAQNREEPMLVFIDEINGRLGGQHVYDAFLAPLEEGVYVRAGKTFHIDPCVWVFAGTESPTSKEESKSDKSDKASDFLSRLTLEPLDLKIRANDDYERNEARVEKIYLGVSLLRSIFPDVRRVSIKVLRAFHTLPPELEARELKNFVRYFTSIRYGEVRANNIPMERFGNLCRGIDIDSWSDLYERETDLVEIRG